MATYPAFPQLADSVEEWIDDIVVDRASNGGTKARSFFTTKKRRFVVRHILGATDASTLQTFYDTYKTAANSFYWEGDRQTYTVLFGPSGVRPRHLAGPYIEFTVELLQQ